MGDGTWWITPGGAGQSDVAFIFTLSNKNDEMIDLFLNYQDK